MPANRMRRGLAVAVAVAVVACLQLGHGQVALAQSTTTQALSKARGFFALPAEVDVDRGAADGDATIMRIMPLYTFPVFDRWKLVNLTIFSLADAPGGTPAFPGDSGGGQKAGLSDFLHASFFTPTRSGNLIWGVGANLSVPSATADSLGAGKWAAGPALRFAYRTELWNLGLVAAQRWSFAGSGNRPAVNQLLMRGAIRRQLPDNWYFVSAPLITANWKSSGEKWLIPLGGGIGRRFSVGDYPWAWSVQAYYNVVKPDPAPDWVFRFGIIAAIPFAD